MLKNIISDFKLKSQELRLKKEEQSNLAWEIMNQLNSKLPFNYKVRVNTDCGRNFQVDLLYRLNVVNTFTMYGYNDNSIYDKLQSHINEYGDLIKKRYNN